MMKKLFAAVILSGIAAVLSAGSPLFEKDVVFHISFDDETIEADITEGSEKPQSKFGKVAFADGISGKALRCGKDGAKVRYLRPDNLNFDRPGTIVFFYKGVDWKTFGKGSRKLMKLGEAIYAQQQAAQQAGAQPNAEAPKNNANDGDVVDAEVVDDK